VRIDLHTHSRVSDGTDAPAEVVAQAARAGLDVVALTDHDTAASWPEAVEAAERVGITLVRGMEISTRHDGTGVHLLAYLPDPTYEPLDDLLRAVLDGRTARAPQMIALLQALDVPITAADVAAVAPATSATGRPHIADALVRNGVVASREEAFATYLNPGRPAYVDRFAPATLDAVRAVVAAGGVPVIAHPWGRNHRERPGVDDLVALAAEGLAGIEVDHHDHTPDQRERLRGIAADLDLVATGSSDFHGLGKVDHDLGSCTTEPEQYERLLAIAAANAAASGRTAPAVVTP
jgi:predicted metal-dependent phosphoesterase TrpH